MIPVYIDSDFKCHTTNPDGLFRKIDLTFDDNICREFIEGHRFVPRNEIYTNADGIEFRGEMFTPWKPIGELETAQREYEKQLLVEYAEALKVVGVTV